MKATIELKNEAYKRGYSGILYYFPKSDTLIKAGCSLNAIIYQKGKWVGELSDASLNPWTMNDEEKKELLQLRAKAARENGKEYCRVLTKREYFAAKALQGLLSTCNGTDLAPNSDTVEYMVKLSVKAADELLTQLEQWRVHL